MKKTKKSAFNLATYGMIEVTARGIPCFADVTYYVNQPALGPTADNDMDCYGYTKLDYDVVDRRGKIAHWITDKMTDSDWDRLDAQVYEKLLEKQEEYDY